MGRRFNALARLFGAALLFAAAAASNAGAEGPRTRPQQEPPSAEAVQQIADQMASLARGLDKGIPEPPRMNQQIQLPLVEVEKKTAAANLQKVDETDALRDEEAWLKSW